jgi:DNA-directed RNA polymerase specialized sigma subunit
VKSFDPQQGAALRTHVYNHLQRLQRVRADRSETVHTPEETRMNSQKVRQFVSGYIDERGIEPSLDSICDVVKLPLRKVQQALKVPSEVSEASVTGETGDVLATPANRTASNTWQDYVYHDLSESNKKLFEWTTGYGGSQRLAKTEIARRLGISPAAVSSRIDTVSKKLQEFQSQD